MLWARYPCTRTGHLARADIELHEVMPSFWKIGMVLGYLARKKSPTSLGTPWDPGHRPTVGS